MHTATITKTTYIYLTRINGVPLSAECCAEQRHAENAEPKPVNDRTQPTLMNAAPVLSRIGAQVD
jgi:hypothetical protein